MNMMSYDINSIDKDYFICYNTDNLMERRAAQMRPRGNSQSVNPIMKGGLIGMNKVVVACVTALIILAVLAPAVLAQGGGATSFQVTNLVVQPSETTVGRQVVITADVANIGNTSGTYTAVLKINGQQVLSVDAPLAPGQKQTVQFQYAPSGAGTFTVSIGEQQTSLKVILASEAKFREGPIVTLRPVTDEINSSQDGLIELFISNPSLNDVTLNGDIYVSVPSGIHVYGQGFGLAGAGGTVYAQFSCPPGTARTIYLNIKADETAVGRTPFIHFEGLYYPGENKDAYNPISLTHPFKVVQASPDPLDPNPTNPEQGKGSTAGGIWMGWWVIIAVVVLGGIATIVAVRSRKTEVSIEK